MTGGRITGEKERMTGFMRKKLRMLAFILVYVAVVLGLMCIFLNLSSIWRIIDALVSVISCILVFVCARCPRCGRFTVPYHPFIKGPVVCKSCGKEID